MPKPKRPEIPSLQISKEFSSNIGGLMDRMRKGFAEEPAPVDSHQPTIPAVHQSPLVDSHHVNPVDSTLSVVDGQTPTNAPQVGGQESTVNLVDSHQTGPVDPRKGDRHRRGRPKFSGRFEPTIHNRIAHYCVDRELSIRDYLEMLAVHHLRLVDSHQDFLVDGPAAHDDMMIFRTRRNIINLFERYVGRKWKVEFDRAGEQFNDLDARLVEIVFIETITKFRAARGNAGKRIGSFNYFLDELRGIQTQAREGMLALDMIDSVLKRRREQWAETEGKR